MARRTSHKLRLRVRTLESRQLLSGILLSSEFLSGIDNAPMSLTHGWVNQGSAVLGATMRDLVAPNVTGANAIEQSNFNTAQPIAPTVDRKLASGLAAQATPTSMPSQAASQGIQIGGAGSNPTAGLSSSSAGNVKRVIPQPAVPNLAPAASDETAQTSPGAQDASDDMQDLATSMVAAPPAGSTGQQRVNNVTAELGTVPGAGAITQGRLGTNWLSGTTSEGAASEENTLSAAQITRYTNLLASDLWPHPASAVASPGGDDVPADHLNHGIIPDVLLAVVAASVEEQYARVIPGFDQLAALAPEALLTGILPVNAAALQGALDHFLQTLEQVGQSVAPVLDRTTLGYWFAGAAALGAALEVARRRSGLFASPAEAGDLSTLIIPGLPSADELPPHE